MASSVFITGLGMVASLGHCWPTACAAARAGLTRAREAEGFTVWSPENGDISPAVVHQIPEITDGFEGVSRIIRILEAALRDLKHNTPSMETVEEDTGWYLSLADPWREFRGSALIADEELRQASLAASKDIPDVTDVDLNLAEEVFHHGLRSMELAGSHQLKAISQVGNCGLAECLDMAVQDLHNGVVNRAVVGGCDTLLAENTLAWLEGTGRLKSPALPTGLMPGEAGVLLVLEISRSTSGPERDSHAVLRSVHRTSEERTLFSGEASFGVGLSDLLAIIHRECQDDNGGRFSLLTDHNGEVYRAAEWGQAVNRALSKEKQFEAPLPLHPAISFGDTGAASGGVAIAMAIHGFRRGYANSAQAVVLSASDGPHRAAIILDRVTQ